MREELSIYKEQKEYDTMRLEQLKEKVSDILKDRLLYIGYEINNNRALASYSISKPINQRKSLYLIQKQKKNYITVILILMMEKAIL